MCAPNIIMISYYGHAMSVADSAEDSDAIIFLLFPTILFMHNFPFGIIDNLPNIPPNVTA